MPKVSYSEEEREKIRDALVDAGLDLMTKQGIQHTTVEQIYRRVGISRTFFYSFFPDQGGSDRGDAVPPAAQNCGICAKADGRSCSELA